MDRPLDIDEIVPEQTIPPESIEETNSDDEIDLLNELVGIDETANVSLKVESIIPEGIEMSDDTNEEEEDE